MKVDIFLDSGAYTAHRQGKEVDLQKYIEYIKENKDYIAEYANLDVIGDAVGSKRNQQIMEDAGLNPIPCFHMGEPWSYLEDYVENYYYIALGGVAQAGKDRQSLLTWMDHCWDIITNDDGIPMTRVHGFAVTALKNMIRYPWYSLDSTSWMRHGRHGNILAPRWKKEEQAWEYSFTPWIVPVSNRSLSKGHFNLLTEIERDRLRDYIESKGFVIGSSDIRKENRETYELKPEERWLNKKDKTDGSVEIVIEDGVSNNYHKRDAMNIMYYCDLEDRMPIYPAKLDREKKVKSLGFRRPDPRKVNVSPWLSKEEMRTKIYLATWLEDNQGETMTEVGAEHRLLSFWFMLENQENFPDLLKQYAATGRGTNEKVWNGRVLKGVYDGEEDDE